MTYPGLGPGAQHVIRGGRSDGVHRVRCEQPQRMAGGGRGVEQKLQEGAEVAVPHAVVQPRAVVVLQTGKPLVGRFTAGSVRPRRQTIAVVHAVVQPQAVVVLHKWTLMVSHVSFSSPRVFNRRAPCSCPARAAVVLRGDKHEPSSQARHSLERPAAAQHMWTLSVSRRPHPKPCGRW